MIKDIAPMAIPYKQYRYLWPPRPELKISPEKLPEYDKGRYLAQPKANGSNMVMFLNGNEVHVKNRHNEDKTGSIQLDYNSLYRGTGWMVLNGEWMEKSKRNEAGENFNGNFIIFDILVYNGYILTGSTFQRRVHLLYELYGAKDRSEYLYATTTPNVYRVKTFEAEFKTMYNLLSEIDMWEGLVLKRKDAAMQPPFTQNNNHNWQIKCRKETKIYKF